MQMYAAAVQNHYDPVCGFQVGRSFPQPPQRCCKQWRISPTRLGPDQINILGHKSLRCQQICFRQSMFVAHDDLR